MDNPTQAFQNLSWIGYIRLRLIRWIARVLASRGVPRKRVGQAGGTQMPRRGANGPPNNLFHTRVRSFPTLRAASVALFFILLRASRASHAPNHFGRMP